MRTDRSAFGTQRAPSPTDRSPAIACEPAAETLLESALGACETERHRLRDEVVLRHLALADAIARQYAGRGLDGDDLRQVARLALCKAARRYRPHRGASFAAFAAPTISGEVKRHFRDHAWLVRPPRRLQELHAQLAPAAEALRAATQHEPTDEMIAAHLGVPTRQVQEARSCERAYHCVPIDDSIQHSHAVACEGGYSRVDDHVALHDALAALTARERRILYLRFVDDCTQAEIGATLGVSQMQVSRLLTGIVTRLRRELGTSNEDRPCGAVA